MTARLPWPVSGGARLHLPRDLQVAYTVGRMGAVTVYDVWPLFWQNVITARYGFLRLTRLGLLRTFDRPDPSHPAWYALTAQGAEWVIGETGADEEELRVISGIRRTNLGALGGRNRFWTSLVLACRARGDTRLALFRPEWELRRLKPDGVVPDGMAVISDGGSAGRAWMIELDQGTERLAVWEAKARAYAALRESGSSLYGASRWSVLAVVPSVRRARTVCQAVMKVGAGHFIFVGTAEALEEGRALDRCLWRATTIASAASAAPDSSLLDGEETPISDPDQLGQSAVDRLPGSDSGGAS